LSDYDYFISVPTNPINPAVIAAGSTAKPEYIRVILKALEKTPCRQVSARRNSPPNLRAIQPNLDFMGSLRAL
jgi:hypothetical protein